MDYSNNPYQSFGSAASTVAYAEESARTTFIRRTYAHLAGAVIAFAAIEATVFFLIPEEIKLKIMRLMFSGWTALFVIGGFLAVSWVAQSWASSSTSLSTQYLGLGLYVLAESVIFIPLLFVANRLGTNIIPASAALTGIIFAGLTMMVFLTRADFSWMGKILWIAGLATFGVAICSAIFGFSLGLLFVGAMVALACGYILYDTSNVLHHYGTHQYVAAALALFASVALLFWYVLRLVMALSDRD